MNKILVIGAINLDIISQTTESIIEHDSNLGNVVLSVGGVAKNIAENLHRLEEDVELLSFFGKDYFGEIIERYLKEIGLPYSLSFISEEYETGKFVAIHDHKGEFYVGINDFSFVENIDLNLIKSIESKIDEFDILVFDTNINEKVLTYLIEKYQDKMIIVDGVSQKKVKRVQSVLPYIDVLKVNLNELSSLLDKKVDDVILGVRELMNSGLKHVIVTNSTEPITYNIERRIYQTLIFESTQIKTSIGAGDALLSGIIYGLSQNKNLHEAVNYGKKAASLTMEVSEANNPRISRKILEE